jgi:hypothetical protein
LAPLGLTVDNLNSWIYYGGAQDQHLNYLKLKEPSAVVNGKSIYEYSESCMVCGCRGPLGRLVHNCYIINPENDDMLVVGYCCIENFLDEKNKKRTCSQCKEPHRNRVDDLCNACRQKKKEKEKESQVLQKKIAKYESLTFKTGKTFKEAALKDRFIDWFWNNQNQSKTHTQFEEYLELIGKGKCEACENTGEMYWTDDVYGPCLQCHRMPKK